MKHKIILNRTKYLQGDYENIITIILTNKDPIKLEEKTDEIIQLAKYANALLISKTKLKAGGESKSKKLILTGRGKDNFNNKRRFKPYPDHKFKFSKPLAHLCKTK